jgi:hypothetical protein
VHWAGEDAAAAAAAAARLVEASASLPTSIGLRARMCLQRADVVRETAAPAAGGKNAAPPPP